jgi:hypothetical protein
MIVIGRDGKVCALASVLPVNTATIAAVISRFIESSPARRFLLYALTEIICL